MTRPMTEKFQPLKIGAMFLTLGRYIAKFTKRCKGFSMDVPEKGFRELFQHLIFHAFLI